MGYFGNMNGPGLDPDLERNLGFDIENVEERFCHRDGKTACMFSWQGEKQYTDLIITKKVKDGCEKILLRCPHFEGQYGCSLMEWCEQAKYSDTIVI